MKKTLTLFLLLCVAQLCALTASASDELEGPKNFSWDGTTVKWEMPNLDDMNNVYITLYTEDGKHLTSSSFQRKDTYYEFDDIMFPAVSYYVEVYYDTKDGNKTAKGKSPVTTVAGENVPVPFKDLELNETGTVTGKNPRGFYTNYEYLLYQKDGDAWTLVETRESSGWTMECTFNQMKSGKTYKAVVNYRQCGILVMSSETAEVLSPVRYTITFNTNGVLCNIFDTQSVVENQLVTMPTNSIDDKKNEGYLVAWATDPEGKNLWNFFTDTPKEDMTLYAVWIKPEMKLMTWKDGNCYFVMPDNYSYLTNICLNLYNTTDEKCIAYSSDSAQGFDGDFDMRSDIYPGISYQYNLELTDGANNRIFTPKSEVYTAPGEIGSKEISKMVVSTVSDEYAVIMPFFYGTYETAVYEKIGKNQWDQIAYYSTDDCKWHSYAFLNATLTKKEYYRIEVRLKQGSLTAMKGTVYYGTDKYPDESTAVSNVAGNGATSAPAYMLNGMKAPKGYKGMVKIKK